MKHTWNICSLALLLTSSLLSSGCHTPALSAMKPDREKWAVGIVGSKETAGSKEVLEYTAKAVNDSAVVFDVRTAEDDGQAQAALSAMASNPNIDLIVTEAKYSPYIAELAKTHIGKKFGLVGNVSDPDSNAVRLVNWNREWLSFVAGFLAGGINPKESVGVITAAPPSPESSEWRGLLEGIHYAGSSASPTVVTLDEAMGLQGIDKLKSISGRVLVLLDPVTGEQLARLQQSGKWLFPLHEPPRMYAGVIARPQPIFAEGVQEEVQSLLNHSWQGGATVAVTGSSLFEIARPEVFPADILNQQKTVVDGLRNQTIQPGQYLNPPSQQNRR
ncbi:type 1 periplasmic-binding domain-containing protein [Effusibacillus pohliae]|uniref:hypothetical protein n=1 Tax=Effusibacillus pohliae TaxID=232270 RepID=UPI00036F6432|nr:hypothetical protein [Effusibacillus pohliae]